MTGIDAVAAPLPPPSPEQKGGRAAMAFGAAVTQRDEARDKARVDPAAPSDKTRRKEKARQDGLGAHVDLQV
jgi:hypothetical protein